MADYRTALCTQTTTQLDRLSTSHTDHPTATDIFFLLFIFLPIERNCGMHVIVVALKESMISGPAVRCRMETVSMTHVWKAAVFLARILVQMRCCNLPFAFSNANIFSPTRRQSDKDLRSSVHELLMLGGGGVSLLFFSFFFFCLTKPVTATVSVERRAQHAFSF